MSPTLFLTLILAPLSVLVMLYVTWPLLRRSPEARPDTGGDADSLNREIVAERRAQLDRELAQLPADSPDRDRLILEFSSAALSDLEGTAAPARSTQSPRWITAALLAGLLVAVPLALYRLAGTPDAVYPDFAQRDLPGGELPRDLPSLAAELQKRLLSEPDNADGWLLLGRTRMTLGDLPAANAALEKALALDSPEAALAAQIRVDLADAIAQSSPSRLTGRPWELIQDALKHDGSNQKALALAGAYQITQGNRTGALSYWRRLVEQLPPGSEQRTQIAGFVADLEAGRKPGAGGAAAANAGPILRGRVELAASLEGRAKAADTVFIAVRSVDADGQPVGPPAAVERFRVADLPLDIELSDRQAMSPAMTLSGQTRVIVVARISHSGNATGSSGDLEGRSGIVAPDAQSVQILIDQVLP